jgi:MFS family permease
LRNGRTTPVIAGSLLGGIPLIIIPFFTHFSILLFLSILYGVGFAMVTSSTPAMVSEIAPQNLTGTAMGFLSMTMDVGQTIGPLITGMLLANLGFQGTFPLLTAVLILSMLLFMAFKGPKKLVAT